MKGINEFIQNLREVYNIVPEGIIVCDPKGKIHFLNHSIISHSGLIDKNFSKIKLELIIRGNKVSELVETLKKKKALISKDKIFHHSGKWSNYTVLSLPLISEKQTVGIIFIIRLDKSIVKINPYTNKNNPIIRVLNEKQNTITFISDFQHYLTLFCSDTIKSICGWSSEEFTLGGWAFSFLLIHPLDRPMVMNLINEEMRRRNENKYVYDQLPIKVRFRFRKKYGDWIWFSDKITVLERDANGNVLYMIGTINAFNPTLEGDNHTSISKLEENIIIRDGQTFINLETLLDIQKKSLQQNLESSSEIIQSFNLTNRELEILSLIVEGFSSEEIGDKIHIAKNTVNMHRKQIMKKMNAKNLAEMVRKSVENGLFLKNR